VAVTVADLASYIQNTRSLFEQWISSMRGCANTAGLVAIGAEDVVRGDDRGTQELADIQQSHLVGRLVDRP